MERIIRRIGLAGVLPITVTAVVGGGALIAFAGDDTTPPAGSANALLRSAFLVNQEPANSGETVHAFAPAGDLDRYLEKLAEKLGISEDALRAAMEEAGLELLDESVANGDISQEMADRIREAIENGDPVPFLKGGFVFPGGLPGPNVFGDLEGGFGLTPFGFGMGLDDNAALASLLGITEAQLRQELNSGKTMAQIAEAHGKSRSDVRDLLTEEHEAKLKEALEAGKLTEAQAEKMRSDFARHVETMLDAQVRIYTGEGDAPPGFKEPFRGWREEAGGVFPGPRSRPSPDSSSEDKTY